MDDAMRRKKNYRTAAPEFAVAFGSSEMIAW